MKSIVNFVGAGPGAEDLITVRGRRLLEEADLVLYAGSLVNPGHLACCKPSCRRLDSAGMDLAAQVECLREAEAFGRQAFASLTRQLNIAETPDPAARDFALTYDAPLEQLVATPPMKGNVPYKTLGPSTPQAPVVNENCYGCGECVDWCPTGAISLQDGHSTTDVSLCTKCCACVKFCPANARTFDTPYTAKLHQHFSARREPELFV